MKRLISSIFLLVALGFTFTSTVAMANSFRVYTDCCDHGFIDPHHPIASGGLQVSTGDDFYMTIKPDAGYKIEYVLINGVNRTTSVVAVDPVTSSLQVTVNEDLEIFVCFESTDGGPFKISARSRGDGEVSHNAGNVVSGEPDARWYQLGAQPSFTFTPDPLFEVNVVYLNGTVVANGPMTSWTYPNPIDVTNDGDLVEVSFRLAPVYCPLVIIHKFLDLDGNEVSADVAKGSTTIPGEGEHIMLEGTPLQITMTPGPYWVVREVSWNKEIIEDHIGYDFGNKVCGDDIDTLIVTFQDDTVSIGVVTIPSLTVSPNPVLGTATISKDPDIVFTHIDVIDITGNAVMYIETPTDVIDFTPLVTGSYIVRFHTVNGFAVRSIIKK